MLETTEATHWRSDRLIVTLWAELTSELLLLVVQIFHLRPLSSLEVRTCYLVNSIWIHQQSKPFSPFQVPAIFAANDPCDQISMFSSSAPTVHFNILGTKKTSHLQSCWYLVGLLAPPASPVHTNNVSMLFI